MYRIYLRIAHIYVYIAYVYLYRRYTYISHTYRMSIICKMAHRAAVDCEQMWRCVIRAAAQLEI